MGTPTTPSSDVCVTAPGCLGCGRQLPAGRSRRFCCPACRRAAYRRRHQPETQKSSRYRLAAHGCKGPSTNAPNARPATSPNNGAPTAHDRVGALDQEETAPAAMR